MSVIISLSCKSISSKIINTIVVRQSSDKCMKDFHEQLKSAKDIVFLTGSGISKDSGLPCFTGAGPVWRNFTSLALTYPPTFNENPSLFWEFYNYRRELAAKARPNEAHIAIANYELKYGLNKQITTITQNVDGMHLRAGSSNVIELCGNLFKTRCTACDHVEINTERPICPALANTGSPEVNAVEAVIAKQCLPRCTKCGGLLRPHIVWFGETLEPLVKRKAIRTMSKCKLCVVVSTRTLVAEATRLLRTAEARGATIAEFNLEPAQRTPKYNYYFQGPSNRTIPVALGHDSHILQN